MNLCSPEHNLGRTFSITLYIRIHEHVLPFRGYDLDSDMQESLLVCHINRHEWTHPAHGLNHNVTGVAIMRLLTQANACLHHDLVHLVKAVTHCAHTALSRLGDLGLACSRRGYLSSAFVHALDQHVPVLSQQNEQGNR